MPFAAIRSLALFFCVVFACPSTGAAEQPPVRVGFFPMPGFHEYDTSGAPAGYDVDYLHRIASYTDRTFRYIRLESWDEALTALAEKRIDLVGSAQLNAERAERFLYSAYSNGITHGAVIILSGNGEMTYEDFDSFSGRRFGCVTTYVRRREFTAYAQEHGFTPDIAWFDSTEQMRKALHAREIDGMVCSVMELGAKEKVVAEFAPAPFFYITWKGNEALLEDLNAAISRIKIDTPAFETSLMDAHYPVFRMPAFSRAELTYVREHPVLRMGHFTNRAPLSAMNPDTGEISGILPEIAELIGQEAGFAVKAVPVPFESIPTDMLKNGTADAVVGVLRFPEQERDPALRLTDPIASARLILLARKGRPFIPTLPLKTAISTGFKGAANFIKTKFPHFTFNEYPGLQSCHEAVLREEADEKIQNAAVLEKFLQNPHYDELAVVPTVNAPDRRVLALPADTDPRLLSILNKSIRRLPQEVTDQIVIKHTVAKPYVITLKDFFFLYRQELAVGAALLALCGVLLAWALRQRRRNTELIRQNEETLRNITNNINGGVITLIADTGFTITYANNGFLTLVGYTRREYEEKRLQECVTYVHPDDIHPLNEAVAGVRRDGETVILEMRILHKLGAYIPVVFRGTLVHNREGQAVLFCVVVDISEQRAMIENLRIEKERYEIVIEQSNDIIFEVDLQQHTLMCSPKFQEKFGWQITSRDIDERSPYPLQVHPEDSDILQRMIVTLLHRKRTESRQLRIRKKDGEYLWCRLLVSCIRHEDKLAKLIGKIEDVDEMVRERLRLEEVSRADALCGLYNKMAFRLSVEHSLKRIKNTAAESSLFFIDIDNFKSVNDRLGHLVGDQALLDVADTLRSLFRADDIIGRYGGDEFCVFAPYMPNAQAEEKAQEINERLRRIYRNDNDENVAVSASIGISLAPRHGATYTELVEKADKALYVAKAGGKDRYIIFDGNDDDDFVPEDASRDK